MRIRSLHPLYKYIVYLLRPWDIFRRTVASASSFRVSFNSKIPSEVTIHNSLPTATKQDEFLGFNLCGSERQPRSGLAFHETIYRNREMVYRPLLIARHAMREPNVTSGVVSLPTSDSCAYANVAA